MAYAVVTAGKGGRRSRLAREVATALARRGLRVGGFVQRALQADGGARTFEAERLGDGHTVRLAGPPPSAGSPAALPVEPSSACAFALDPVALAEARRWIEADLTTAEVLVIDGMGRIELSGEGHRPVVARALSAAPLVVLALRDDQLVYALEALGLQEEPLAAFAEGEPPEAFEAFVDALARAATRGARRT